MSEIKLLLLSLLLDVLEVPVNVNDPMSGYKYIVDHGREGQREFSDLDELIVNHVKAMARKVEELMAHDKYKAETPAQLGASTYLQPSLIYQKKNFFLHS